MDKISFVRNYKEEFPHAIDGELQQAWNEERERQKEERERQKEERERERQKEERERQKEERERQKEEREREAAARELVQRSQLESHEKGTLLSAISMRKDAIDSILVKDPDWQAILAMCKGAPAGSIAGGTGLTREDLKAVLDERDNKERKKSVQTSSLNSEYTSKIMKFAGVEYVPYVGVLSEPVSDRNRARYVWLDYSESDERQVNNYMGWLKSNISLPRKGAECFSSKNSLKSVVFGDIRVTGSVGDVCIVSYSTLMSKTWHTGIMVTIELKKDPKDTDVNQIIGALLTAATLTTIWSPVGLLTNLDDYWLLLYFESNRIMTYFTTVSDEALGILELVVSRDLQPWNLDVNSYAILVNKHSQNFAEPKWIDKITSPHFNVIEQVYPDHVFEMLDSKEKSCAVFNLILKNLESRSGIDGAYENRSMHPLCSNMYG